jgi:hypothetical protein
VVEAELDTGAAARRLRKDIKDVFGHDSDLAVVHPGGLRKGNRYLVRVVEGGDRLARQSGLVDATGRPVRGLPPAVVNGAICDAESAWRGAFLAHGSLTEPGRSSALEITCRDLGRTRAVGRRRRACGRGARCAGRPGRRPRRRHHQRDAHALAPTSR